MQVPFGELNPDCFSASWFLENLSADHGRYTSICAEVFEELSVMSPLLGAEEGGTSDVTKVVGISSLKDSPDGLSLGLKERNSLIVPQLIAQRF
ncbi:hypothetical protein SAY86_032104 [Trapa natans]|uniref:Uncharacterized protein n=1 Tax=Trapa natans TaxID=22666 RepID=A0AAN7M884_TRANT|nr:hypothetical protein SAY86_032104 [Trapa natans]